MMKKVWKATIVICLLIAANFSLEAKTSDADVQTVYEMFEAQGLPEQMNRVIETLVDSQVKAVPQLKAYREDLLKFFMRVASYEALKKDVALIYLKHFTLDEIREITKFYRSPIGKKMKSVSASIMVEANELSTRKIQAVMPELFKELQKKRKY